MQQMERDNLMQALMINIEMKKKKVFSLSNSKETSNFKKLEEIVGCTD
jgi:UV DNA damage repair endonuclease